MFFFKNFVEIPVTWLPMNNFLRNCSDQIFIASSAAPLSSKYLGKLYKPNIGNTCNYLVKHLDI